MLNLVRKVRRDEGGRWRYADGSDRGRFAKKADIDAYRLQQKINSYGSNVPRDESLQNSITTVAVRFGLSLEEARERVVGFVRAIAQRNALGEEIQDFADLADYRE